MSKRDKVMLRVWISEELRIRIRAQAVRMKMTMGELIEEIMNDEKSLESLEREWIDERRDKK